MEAVIARGVRILALLVIFFFMVSTIMALGRAETGWLEKVVLFGVVVGLVILATTVRRWRSSAVGSRHHP